MILVAVSVPDVVFLFTSAGLVLYVSSRAAADAVTSISDPCPGKLALAQWMPIAWTAMLAALIGRLDVAIGVAFATSVAALGLGIGTLLIIAPRPDTSTPRAGAWPFVIPAALLVLLAGFRAALTWWHAVMMLVLGVAVCAVWNSKQSSKQTQCSEPTDPPVRRAIQLLLAIALGGVGAWLILNATRIADERTRVATGGLIATAILGPLLVLPLLGVGAFAAQHGRTGSGMAGMVGFVLLNLCLLVPLIVLLGYARNLWIAWAQGVRGFDALLEHWRPIPFPLAVWRVDTVLIMVAGLLLVPVSLGRWNLGRTEGGALTLGYVAYLVVSTLIAIRI